jgi:hypothetical protein
MEAPCVEIFVVLSWLNPARACTADSVDVWASTQVAREVGNNFIKLIHLCIAHPGRLATRRLISSRFVWPGLNKDVTAWARE